MTSDWIDACKFMQPAQISHSHQTPLPKQDRCIITKLYQHEASDARWSLSHVPGCFQDGEANEIDTYRTQMMHASSCSPPRYPTPIKSLPQSRPDVSSPHFTNANQLTRGGSSTTFQAASKNTKQTTSAPIGRRMMHACFYKEVERRVYAI